MEKRELLGILENIDFDIQTFRWNRDGSTPFSRMNIDIICRETADIMESIDDWKILDVNCLPELPADIYEKDKYDFEMLNNEEYRFVIGDVSAIIESVIECKYKYRYRLKPIKKSHEELAEEYATKDYIHAITKPNHDFKEWNYYISKAFIAGRKSMEGERK